MNAIAAQVPWIMDFRSLFTISHLVTIKGQFRRGQISFLGHLWVGDSARVRWANWTGRLFRGAKSLLYCEARNGATEGA